MSYDTIISLREIWKRYPGPAGEGEIAALAGVSFDIDRGSYVAIMGPSGSGKSTLLSILGCLDVPTSGRYLLDRRPVEQLSDDELASVRNDKLGFVFQAFHLLSNSTALRNVELPLVYSRRFTNHHAERAADALKIVGLADRISHYPKQLSGGQKQRVAIARAIVTDPVCILADEPTGALDSKSGGEILRLFKRLHSMGRTVVVVTHEPEVAIQAQRLLMIRDGRVLADGSPRAILARYSSTLGFAPNGR